MHNMYMLLFLMCELNNMNNNIRIMNKINANPVTNI